jgi:hypothetical protein
LGWQCRHSEMIVEKCPLLASRTRNEALLVKGDMPFTHMI